MDKWTENWVACQREKRIETCTELFNQFGWSSDGKGFGTSIPVDGGICWKCGGCILDKTKFTKTCIQNIEFTLFAKLFTSMG